MLYCQLIDDSQVPGRILKKSESPGSSQAKELPRLLIAGVDPVKSGLIGPLSSILTQLVRGGGARGFNINEVSFWQMLHVFLEGPWRRYFHLHRYC